MEKIVRSDAPEWLEEKWEEWGREWAAKLEETRSSRVFSWRRNKKCGYEELIDELSEMTNDHCSFCDSYPMVRRIRHTIEHFKPKTKFPLLAYKWNNLFLCCDLCQQKGDEFDEKLLKPDDDDYCFDDFFDIKWDTGELIPNVDASEKDRQRAETTIRLYGLNEHGKPEDRLEELYKFNDSNHPDIERFSYRFFLSRGYLP